MTCEIYDDDRPAHAHILTSGQKFYNICDCSTSQHVVFFIPANNFTFDLKITMDSETKTLF